MASLWLHVKKCNLLISLINTINVVVNKHLLHIVTQVQSWLECGSVLCKYSLFAHDGQPYWNIQPAFWDLRFQSTWKPFLIMFFKSIHSSHKSQMNFRNQREIFLKSKGDKKHIKIECTFLTGPKSICDMRSIFS